MPKTPEANRANAKRWRQENPERYRANQNAAHISRQLRNREWVLAYLLEHPCVDCGEGDPIVLHFDHRDGQKKYKGVSFLVKKGRSLEVIKSEVEKCDVRCANCHMRRTAKQFGWWKFEENQDAQNTH
jgi:phage-related protein